MPHNHEPLFLGAMCGTSMDAVDVALVRFNDNGFECLATYRLPVPSAIRQKALHYCTFPSEHSCVAELDKAYGDLFSEACNGCLASGGFSASDICAIGSHGQTLRHYPNASPPYSLQVGDPMRIAKQTGIRTISSFRQADLAAGGQGAPLAPAFHRWFFSHYPGDYFIANVGGIANITWLPEEASLPVLGFDTGPGNALLDAWYHRFFRQPFDEDGHWAASGRCHEGLLLYLQALDFFHLPPPKSTGKECFNLAWVDQAIQALDLRLPAEDVQRTLLQLTLWSLSTAIESLSSKSTVLLCGGGCHNAFFMSLLERALAPNHKVSSTLAYGIDPSWMEAICFAWLARERVAGRAANLPSVTGAQQAVLLGEITEVADSFATL